MLEISKDDKGSGSYYCKQTLLLNGENIIYEISQLEYNFVMVTTS